MGPERVKPRLPTQTLFRQLLTFFIARRLKISKHMSSPEKEKNLGHSIIIRNVAEVLVHPHLI